MRQCTATPIDRRIAERGPVVRERLPAHRQPLPVQLDQNLLVVALQLHLLLLLAAAATACCRGAADGRRRRLHERVVIRHRLLLLPLLIE